jgi:hypothetical protein
MIAFIHLYQTGTCAWCVYQFTIFISLAEDRYFWKKKKSLVSLGTDGSLPAEGQ